MSAEAVVKAEDDGIRLDRWFRRHYPTLNHAYIEKALRKGQIRLDGKKAKASGRISTGQTIRFPAVEAEAPAPRKERAVPSAEAEALRRAVLYEDGDVIVINKPPGLAVQGGTGQARHLDAMLGALGDGTKAGRPRLVHRLDKDTSGVLLLAKSARAAAELGRLFANREVEKTYWALAIGVPRPREGRIALRLAKAVSKQAPEKETMAVVEKGGQPAVSFYRVRETVGGGLSWLELKPETGRTHQLRVHLAAIGHPLLGDAKYGGREACTHGLWASAKLHLHARRVVIPSLFGHRLEVEAALPAHMAETWRELGLGSARDLK